MLTFSARVWVVLAAAATVALICVPNVGVPQGAGEAATVTVDENNVPRDQVDQRQGVSSEATPGQGELPEMFVFPATGDTRFNQSGTNFWNLGDYVEGVRTFTVSTQQMDMVLQIESNVLSCDTQDHDFMVDGVTIGSFVINQNDTQIVQTFNFAQIDPGPHTLRIETTRTVNPGCGSAGFPNDVSTVDFIEVPVELMSLTVE
jgi:hypothetical protein